MNEVTRYDLTEDVSTGEVDITPVPERMQGRYVTFEDYEALARQLTATTNSLTNAQEALKSAAIEADTVQAGVMELVSKMNRLSGDREKFAVQCAAAKIAVQYARAKGFECSLNTPDVDAYLNAVRADAVEDVAKRLYGQGYNFEVLTRFSAQLRSGNAGKDGSHE